MAVAKMPVLYTRLGPPKVQDEQSWTIVTSRMSGTDLGYHPLGDRLEEYYFLLSLPLKYNVPFGR